MSKRFTRSTASIILSSLLAVGCASWDKTPSGDDIPDEQQQKSLSTSGTFRESGPTGQLLGLDERSRAIERNLGIR